MFCLDIGPHFGCTDAHVSSKVIKENTFKKFVSLCMSVCPRSFGSSGHKNSWRYSYKVLYLDQMFSKLKSETYNILIFKPQKGVLWTH